MYFIFFGGTLYANPSFKVPSSKLALANTTHHWNWSLWNNQ